MYRIFVLILALLLLVPGLSWFFSDDELDDGAERWKYWHERHQDQWSAGQLWLLGLDAPPHIGPEEAGRAWLESLRLERRVGPWQAHARMERPWQADRLKLPDRGHVDDLLACRELTEPGCSGMEDKLESHRVLLDRYRKWPLDTAFNITAPELVLNSPMQLLMAADRLARLDALHRLLIDEQGNAMAYFEALHDRPRQLLARSENLVMMVVAIRMIAEQVDWLIDLHADGIVESEWLTRQLVDIDGVGELLTQVMRGEYGLVLEAVEWLEKDGDLHGGLGIVDRFMLRLFHRPNMTRNALYERYARIASLSDARQLSAMASGREALPEATPSLRNYFSYINPAQLPEGPEFIVYVAQLHDLRAKLALARTLVRDAPQSDDDLHRLVRVNPYGWRHGVELDEGRNRLCLAGPLQDQSGIRCIRLAP